jgi:outer membrane autotransporter protein
VISQTAGLISGPIKLSANADVLNISGGTVNGSIIGQGSSDTVNLSGGTVVLVATNNVGMVTMTGGTLNIGDASHTGTTLTLTGGTPLDVIGGTLSGHGTLIGGATIEAGGTLRPGGSIGTLTINGNLAFSAGSTYAIELSPTQHSQTNVTCNVMINGGSVVLAPQQGLYNKTTVKILTSTGVLSGTFAPTLTFSGAVTLSGATLSYDSHDVFLSYLAALLAAPANASLNVQKVTHTLDSFLSAGVALPSGLQNLAVLSGNALNNAVNQLGGQTQGSFAPVAFNAGDMFLKILLDPYIEGRSGIGRAGTVLSYAPEQPAAPTADAFSALALGPRAFFEPRMSFWASAYGGDGRISGNATTGVANTASQIYGLATGLDYRISSDTLIGLALGGGGTAWQLGQGLGSGHSGMFQSGAYGTTHFGPAYVSGALAYSLQEVTTNRNVTLAGFDSLQGDFAANVLSTRLEGGYRLSYGMVAVTPYAALQNQELLTPSFSEFAASGASQFALSYTSRTFSATRTELGAWFDSDALMDKGLKLYGRLAWAHDFDNEGAATAFFQSLPGSNFLVNSSKPARDGALTTVGFEYKLADGWSVLAKFDGEFSPTTAIFAGTGTIRKVW